jgi:hypothetical protein
MTIRLGGRNKVLETKITSLGGTKQKEVDFRAVGHEGKEWKKAAHCARIVSVCYCYCLGRVGAECTPTLARRPCRGRAAAILLGARAAWPPP